METGLSTLRIDLLYQPYKFTLKMDDLKLLSAEVGVQQHPRVRLSGFCLYRKVAYWCLNIIERVHIDLKRTKRKDTLCITAESIIVKCSAALSNKTPHCLN